MPTHSRSPSETLDALDPRRPHPRGKRGKSRTARASRRTAGRKSRTHSQAAGRAGASPCRLTAPGWNELTRAALEKLIREGAGRQLPVVFDFDNTIVYGDIGEATLALLARSGRLTPQGLPPTLCPVFRQPGKGRIELSACADVLEYYQAFLAPTAHGSADPSPLANGYALAVEIMEGLRVLDVVEATRTAFGLSRAEKPAFIQVAPGKTAFPVPFFYPEMVELLGELLRHEFAVWIVSASNVWSVRWMVLRALNPLLRARGLDTGIQAERVIGISTLLTDQDERLYKDTLLVREHPGYAALDERTLGELWLTSRLQFPLPTYSGKVACIFDLIGRRPYLSAGDGPGDHAMMAISRHRLWIARQDKRRHQQAIASLIRQTGKAGWMIQAAQAGPAPAFLNHHPDACGRISA